MLELESHVTIQKRAYYSPPWADVSIIAVAGSSGSGKSTLSQAIVKKLNLPWVVILSMDSFYKTLTPEQSKLAFANEYDFDSPDIYCEADADTCLSRRIVRDVRERGRDIEGCIKQWFGFVKPNFEKFVEPQRKVADLIVPRGIENRVALDMMVQFIEKKLFEKSIHHREALSRLEATCKEQPLSDRVVILDGTPQLKVMNTILQDVDTSAEDFIFYFDRLAALIIEEALNSVQFVSLAIETPQSHKYQGLKPKGEVSAVIVLRGGSAFESALRKTIPDCRTGRLLIQSDFSTGEPELHYLRIPEDIHQHESVLLLDTQMASGGAALMAVQVLAGAGFNFGSRSNVLATARHKLNLSVHYRSLTGKPLPQVNPWVLNFCYRAGAWLGISITVLGIGVIAFFLYDATTYKQEGKQNDINVSQLALQPRRGGPDNLPIAEVFIDDDDCEAKKRIKDKPRLVVLGGGWGGVALLKALNPDDYHVTVISPTNYFLFTPMLPSATVGTLELRSLVEPIRRVLSRVHGHFIRAKAEDVHFSDKLVEVSQLDSRGNRTRFYVPYDKLVIAVGSVTNPHGVKGLDNAFFLKDINDARKVRNQVVRNLEAACLPTTSDEERKRLLSFVVSGGGPTGVEFAAEMYDLLNEDLTRHFPRLLRNEISVHLIQSRSHILNTYDETVSKYAEDRFARDQVDVLTNSRVKEVCPDKIIFTQKQEDGSLVTKELPAGFVLWSTGVSPTALCQKLAQKLGNVQTNRHALETDTHLRLNGTPLGDVYAIGDCSTVQNNVADHIITFLRTLAWKHGKDPETLQLHFKDWRQVAHDVKKRFPQSVNHLKRLDKLFAEFDKDQSGTLDFGELRELLNQIDSKLTSLPATAQRAHQQGYYLAQKFNKLAHLSEGLSANDIRDGDLDAAAYKAFEYHHLGSLAYIGNSAVFDLGEGWSIAGGLWAVYAWRSVYFAQSVSFRTRCLLAMDWAKRGLFGRDLMSF
ncbi:Pyridine nucleotide-disulfide oxidoreductase, FAD/NAD(P)-binding domain protein [Metarhizium album ARSEF 1941]|uniref:uridine/cytidine kinase n=1 Tax=Metarhizium album (strain ARSEF 1941) TaxID=1081103 RepID=A0A0B2X278_METAS|nr:Pyridine nucleotide-disulfide oxidoreductase, FAD/NAD(P)-binding domain protein [Metarhizium album ARSEF 1941]KHN99310.1 Pyridine nucleotide-disulfide oxidoreductase, FAD/NAD(P)-binding domain protein [Metarhizium album ARSEF 1941]